MIEKTLESFGFKNRWEDELGSREHPFGEFWDKDGNRKICLKDGCVYAYSLDHAFDPCLELFLNFNPTPQMLSSILKKTFYL